MAAVAARVNALDGLRGIGLLLVLMRHVVIRMPEDAPLYRTVARITSLSISAMDMFFVASGFLITGLLYDAKTRPNYFRNYFARRCLRIFPLYYVSLAILFWVVPALPVALPPAYDAMLERQGWYWTYTCNVLHATDGLTKQAYIAHFWSLAVEEQFYLVWPILIWFLGRRGIIRLCVSSVFFAFAFRLALHFTEGGTDGIYVLTPARVDALAIGSLLAILSRDPGGLQALAKHCVRPLWVALAIMAVIVVHGGGYSRKDPVNYLLGFTTAAIFYGAAIVLLTVNPSSLWTRVIAHPFFAHLGRHSYAAYIAHFPLLSLILYCDPPTAASVRLGGTVIPAVLYHSIQLWVASYCASILAWHLFEKRFLALKRFFPAPPAVRLDEPALQPGGGAAPGATRESSATA